METKHIIALAVFTAAGCASLLVQLVSARARDIAFFLMVACAVLNEKMDVNFLGEYWYRGTSRGMGISLLDAAAWGLLGATILLPKHERRRWLWPASTGLILLYFLYCIFSTVMAQNPRFALWELVSIPRALLFLITAAMFVRTQRELRILVLGLCGAIAIEAVYALKQHFVLGMYRVPGTLAHPNSLSMYLCMVGPVCLAGAFCQWPKWMRVVCTGAWMVAGAVVVMTISRAGIPIYGAVTLGVAVFCSTWQITRQKIMIVFATTAVMGGVLLKAWPLIAARFENVSLAQEYIDVDGENRGVYWRWALMMVDDYPYGTGLNNWSYMVSKQYGHRLGFPYQDYDDIKTTPEKADLPSISYAPPAHSLVALTIGELGWLGLFVFVLVWVRWFLMGITFLKGRLNPDPMHRIGIGLLFSSMGIFLQSVTEWTYRQTTMLVTFHILMGVLASLYYHRKHPSPQPVVDEFEPDDIEIEATPLPAGVARQHR